MFQLQGNHPSMKAEGIQCIVYKNINGIKLQLANNLKLMKFCNVIDNLQADVVCINEQVTNGPQQLFGWEAAISTIEGHN